MSRWRVGRSLGRTLYKDDRCVGIVDTPELAAEIVEACNRGEVVIRKGKCPPGGPSCLACDRIGWHLEPEPATFLCRRCGCNVPRLAQPSWWPYERAPAWCVNCDGPAPGQPHKP
jgi:hypothetical protein